MLAILSYIVALRSVQSQESVLADWTVGGVEYYLIEESTSSFDEKEQFCFDNFVNGSLAVIRNEEQLTALAEVREVFTFEDASTYIGMRMSAPLSVPVSHNFFLLI